MKNLWRVFLFTSMFATSSLYFLVPKAFATNFNLGAAIKSIFESKTFYGDGSDGALTVNSTTGTNNGPTNPYIVNATTTALTADAAVGATTLTVGSITGFTAGKELLIIQMSGTNAGYFEFVKITSSSGSTITLTSALTRAYNSASKTQVILVKQYSTLTINSGAFLTVPAYSSATGTGGVLVMKANTSITINNGGGGLSGTISAGGGYTNFASRGFAGGSSAVGSGTGGGAAASNSGGTNTSPGMSSGLIMGSGGGSAANTGGTGGGVVIVKAKALTLNGNIYANGTTPTTGNAGGGSGGTILVSAETISTSASCGTVSAAAGNSVGTGTAGGNGRIHIQYFTSLGCFTATPTTTSNYIKFYEK